MSGSRACEGEEEAAMPHATRTDTASHLRAPRHRPQRQAQLIPAVGSTPRASSDPRAFNSAHSLDRSDVRDASLHSGTATAEGSDRGSSDELDMGLEEEEEREDVDSLLSMHTPASPPSLGVLGSARIALGGRAPLPHSHSGDRCRRHHTHHDHPGELTGTTPSPSTRFAQQRQQPETDSPAADAHTRAGRAPASRGGSSVEVSRASVSPAARGTAVPTSHPTPTDDSSARRSPPHRGAAECASSGSSDGANRSRHRRPQRSAERNPFLAAGSSSPTFPQPTSTSPAGVAVARDTPHAHNEQRIFAQQLQERRVYYGTQRQHPPVCASRTLSSRDWVRLNVGGRLFVSTFATLCADPNSVLAHICEPLRDAWRRAEGEAAQPRAPSPSDTADGGLNDQQRRRRRRQQQQQQQQGVDAGGLVGFAARANGGGGGLERRDDREAVGDRAPGEASQSGGASPRGLSMTSPTGHLPRSSGGAAKGTDDGADPLPAPHHKDPYADGCGVSGGAAHPAGGELPNPGGDDPFAVAPLDVDEHHSILLDLDPDYFAPILNYLRHRTVFIPPSLRTRGVLAVATYLNVQGMVRQLAPERRVRRQVLSSWGSGGSGELGTQRFQDSEAPTPVQVTPFGVKVVHMALGANYSCALSDDGNIYTFGNGDWGQLGLGSPKDLDVHPSDKSAVVVVPRRIPLFETHRALHVSAGYAFAMAIIKDYHVYFWGNNNHGQSGLGPRFFDYNTRKVDEPKLVDTLEGKRIVQIDCGSFFSLALSEDGTLYSWGLIECLGLGTPDEVRRKFQDANVLGESLSNERRGVVLSPQPVNMRGNGPHRIIRIHAGQWHSGAINSAGELFTWGVGYQGRLGHGTKEPAYVPTKVRGALTGHRVVDVACGSFHTVALTDRGAVSCWGDNASGQCGTSAAHAEAVTSPYRVVGLEFIAGGLAKGISCGRQHTVVVMEGPQPGCQGPCCQLDYRGRPYHAHAQVYTFGESARGGAASATTATTAAAAGAQGSGTPSGTAGSPGTGVHGVMGTNGMLLGQGGRVGGRGSAMVDSYGAGAGAGGRTCSQYQLVPGLERMNVVGVVSGLHHTFAYAEEIECGHQHQPSGHVEEGEAWAVGGGYSHASSFSNVLHGGGGVGGPGSSFASASAGAHGNAFAGLSSFGGRDTQQQWPPAQESWGGGTTTGIPPSPYTRL